jgi:hypothetical protein
VYAVGVTNVGNVPSGVYLFGQEFQGWGRSGLGAVDRNEGLGQNRGRWFTPVPFGVAPVGEYPSVASYNGRSYLCGGYGYNLILDEHHRMWKQGIRPPEAAPDISGAAGTTVLAYLSFFDELTNERSPLSVGTEISTATPRTWNNLPTRPPDDVYVGNDIVTADTFTADHRFIRHPLASKIDLIRPGDRYSINGTVYAMFVNPNCKITAVAPAPGPLEDVVLVERTGDTSAAEVPLIVAPVIRPTHVELWLSFAGDLPRLAMRVAIGTTSVVESKGIGDLGEAFITQFQRFPRCSMNAIYHDRQIMAGDAENPDTIYLSALFNPERFEGLTFRTRDGRAITGLLATRDFCMVLTRYSAYLLQGYTDTDYTLNPVDQSIGAVGHHCNVLIHGNPYVWSEKGPYMYNGSWHPLSPENRWTAPVDGHLMVATEHPFYNTYIVSQAFRAAKSFQEPYNTWRQTGALENLYGAEFTPTTLPELKYFAVLDYTLVQPETGGAVLPARLSWDTTDFYLQDDAETKLAFYDDQVFMKYLRNRYGRGNLYRIQGFRRFGDDVAYDVNDWIASVPSFVVGGLLLPEAAIQLDLMPEEESEIITPFDYMGDGGGYLMEQKSIKRLWYYMRMDNGLVSLFVSPGPGYWGSRIFPVTVPPIQFDTLFTAGEYRGGSIETPHADVIMPVLPDALAGRGMWLHLRGTKLFFSGYAVQSIWGSETAHIA